MALLKKSSVFFYLAAIICLALDRMGVWALDTTGAFCFVIGFVLGFIYVGLKIGISKRSDQ